MSKPTDVRIKQVETSYIPVAMRVPLKFGPESVRSVNCIRVAVTVSDDRGASAIGWGETPLSVTWAWPSLSLTYHQRYEAMVEFCAIIQKAWSHIETSGHPIEIGHSFLQQSLPNLLSEFNDARQGESMPHLAALIAASAFDIATHDAYGVLHRVDIFDTYHQEFMTADLSQFLTSDDESVSFDGKFPSDFLATEVPVRLPVWHLVGGLDPLEEEDLTGDEPDDEYPVTLRQWIVRDGLECLKIKLRGTDQVWDYDRLNQVGQMSIELGVKALSADFN